MQIGLFFIRKCWNYRNMDVVTCSCENESTFGQSRSTKWNLLDSFMTKFCSFGCNNSTFKGLFLVFSCRKRSNPSFWAEFWQKGIHLTTLKAFHNPKYYFFPRRTWTTARKTRFRWVVFISHGAKDSDDSKLLDMKI